MWVQSSPQSTGTQKPPSGLAGVADVVWAQRLDWAMDLSGRGKAGSEASEAKW